MSFYAKDDAKHLDQAFESLHQQHSKAGEIILVQDGKVPEPLELVVSKWEKKLPIKKIVNKKNLGLGESLRKGLEVCSSNFVARMDADDICHPDRFKVQFDFLKKNPGISVVGSWIAEFSDDVNKIDSFRRLPSNPDELYQFAKLRCPLNHPTVMYRKSDIISVGSYQPYRFQQDYHLWGRLLKSGFKIANIPAILLYMRTDLALFGRRGGLDYFRTEMAVQKDFLKIGFISRYEYLRNYIVRGGVRIIPTNVRKSIYQHLLRGTLSFSKKL